MPVSTTSTSGRTPEHPSVQLEAAAHERLESLKQTPKVTPEPAGVTPAAPAAPEPAPPAPYLDRRLNYHQTLSSLRRNLGPVGRAFSRVIHAPVLEKSIEVLGATIARPSVLNGAIWSALLVGLVFYVTARAYGFPLSGSEMLLALAGGAILGLCLEAAGRLFRRR